MTATVGMALAAGLGTRMRPLTDSRPKGLVEVGGKALVDHALDRLVALGAGRVVVNVHHFADMMESHLRMRTPPPLIDISDERALLLDTGGGLVKAKSLLGGETALVTNTDAIFLADPDAPEWRDVFAGFDPEHEDARLLLVEKHRATGLSGPGDFELGADGRLNRRPKDGTAPYFYTGTQILNTAVLEGWPEEPFSMNRVWDKSLAEGRLTGVVFRGDWLHVGDPGALERARERLEGRADT